MLGEGEDAAFLSTTSRGAAFGWIPPLVRGQEALVLAPGAPRVRLPEGAEDVDRRSIEVEATVASDGSAQVRVVETFRGGGAVGWRSELESIPDATLEQVFEEQYVSRLVPGATLTDLRISGRRDAERPLVFEYGFEVRSFGRRQGGEWIVPGLFPANLSPVYARAGARTTAQLVAPPLDLDVTVVLRMPADARPRTPDSVALRGPGGAAVRIDTETEGSVVTTRRRVRLPLMRVSPDAYPRFAEFCRAADEAEAREIRIRM
jgi:hypothetical protein